MIEVLFGMNYLAVAAAVISSWLLGGIWYSKHAFGGIWCAENSSSKNNKRHPVVIFITAFILWTITAIAFGSAIGEGSPFWYATLIGFLTGTCFVTTSFGVNYAFAGRSIKLFLIDAGYLILQFTLYGMIFGYWA